MATRWRAAYATGVALLDRQHEEIFERADGLLGAMTENRGEVELRALVGFLTSYVHGHLRDEEALMAGSRYPNLAIHIAQHTAFEDQLVRLEGQLAREGVNNALLVETATFVSAWLRGHIATSDQVFARFLARSEIASPAQPARAAPETARPPAETPTERRPEPARPPEVTPAPKRSEPARPPEASPDALPVRLVAPGFEEVELPPLPPDALRN